MRVQWRNIRDIKWQGNDALKLKIFRQLSEAGMDVDSLINERASILRRLSNGVREDGRVLVVQSGRDCDGSVYWGRRHWIAPTLVAYMQLERGIAEWADGPFSLSIVPCDEEMPEWGSRDLAMEAYEDGHPHVLYY